MTIEADLFLARRRGPDPLIKSISIEANGSRRFNYPRLANVLVICDEDGNGGGILIKDPGRVGVRFYESEEDEEGRIINPEKPVRLEKGQEVIIWSEKSRKQLNIYIEADEEDESPIEPPKISANS